VEAQTGLAAPTVAAQGSALADGPATKEHLVVDDGLPCLTPGAVRLYRGPTGVLRATIEEEPARSYLHVLVYRAFPLSEPAQWVVLLDGQAKEIGMIEDPAALDPESQALCAEELELRYLTPHVTAVREIREDTLEGGGAWSPVLVWELVTDRGPMRLRLPNLLDHIRLLGPGRLLIWDRDGRRAEFADIAALDESSRRWLKKYLWM